MTKISVKAFALITGLSALDLMVGRPGCAGRRSTGRQIDDNRMAERHYNQRLDQRTEDSRTAGRVREALASS